MIAPHLEPKGLDRDTPPLLDAFKTAVDRDDATRGSAMLFAALRRAQKAEATRKLTIADLSPILAVAFSERLTALRIQATVSQYYGIHEQKSMRVGDNARGAREKRYARPRQVAMFFTRKLTGMSYPEIGRRFGGRDHTTVIHAIKAVERRAADDPLFDFELEILRERLVA